MQCSLIITIHLGGLTLTILWWLQLYKYCSNFLYGLYFHKEIANYFYLNKYGIMLIFKIELLSYSH